MNWVSYSEDIEDLRQENEHYMRGFDNLLSRLKEPPNLIEIQQTDIELRKLQAQLIRHFEQIKKQAQSRFEEAIKLLRDPGVLITSRLDKRTRERNDARSALADCQAQLEACRTSQKKSLTRIAELAREKTMIQSELQQLKDQLYMKDELKDVQPLRRK